MLSTIVVLICTGVLFMAIRESTAAIIAKIEALKALPADDGITQETVDAAVAEANAAKDALIAADTAEDQEQVDAINAALDASPVTPNGTPE